MTWVAPRTWNSELITDGKLNEISSSLKAVGNKPPSYTPSVTAGWTSNFTVGGSASAAGNWVDFLVTVNFTGVPAGSGGVLITLPSTPSADYPTWAAIGGCTIRDASTTSQTVGDTVYANLFGGVPCISAYFSATTRLANAAPVTLASGDYITFTGRYYID